MPDTQQQTVGDVHADEEADQLAGERSLDDPAPAPWKERELWAGSEYTNGELMMLVLGFAGVIPCLIVGVQNKDTCPGISSLFPMVILFACLNATDNVLKFAFRTESENPPAIPKAIQTFVSLVFLGVAITVFALTIPHTDCISECAECTSQGLYMIGFISGMIVMSILVIICFIVVPYMIYKSNYNQAKHDGDGVAHVAGTSSV